jgi:hypothetical protein
MTSRYLVTILLVYLSVGPAEAADEQEIIALCREGHLQARSAIQQLSCDMELRIARLQAINPFTGKREDHPAEVQHYSWWEDQDVARCTGTFGEFTHDFLWQEGTLKHLELRNLQRGAKAISPVGRWEGPNGIKHVQTAWRSALFYRPDEFREMMRPDKIVSASEEVQGGRRLYKITVNRQPNYREDIFFDPRRNYVVAKVVGYPDLKDLSSQHRFEVTNFTEPKPGIYFPGSVKNTYVNQGKSEPGMTTTFTNVRINERIDPNKLHLRFPAGTQVTDLRSGKTYQVDENEQPVGPEKPMAKPRNLIQERIYPTALQPSTPWPTIALGTVAGVLGVVGLGFLVWRRRRAVRGAELSSKA